MGRRRVLHRHFRRSGRGYGLFRPPHHRDLAAIVSYRSVREARLACHRLRDLYIRARTRKRRLTILKAAWLAATRARVFALKHPNIGPEVRRRLLRVSEEYEQLARELSEDYRIRYGD